MSRSLAPLSAKNFKARLEAADNASSSLTDDVQALLIFAGEQVVLHRNKTFVNDIASKDFRGSKREAIMAWMVAFLPVKPVRDEATKKITGFELMAKPNQEKAIELFETGKGKNWSTFKTETDGEKAAKEYSSLVETRRFMARMTKELLEGKGKNVSSIELDKTIKLLKTLTKNLDAEAKTRAAIESAEESKEA